MDKPAKPIRLMVSLLILKHLRNLSDEVLVEQWPKTSITNTSAGFSIFIHPLCSQRLKDASNLNWSSKNNTFKNAFGFVVRNVHDFNYGCLRLKLQLAQGILQSMLLFHETIHLVTAPPLITLFLEKLYH